MITYNEAQPEEQPYRKYKAEKFESYKLRIENALSGIGETSLKDVDKERLLTEIKTIVKNFKHNY